MPRNPKVGELWSYTSEDYVPNDTHMNSFDLPVGSTALITRITSSNIEIVTFVGQRVSNWDPYFFTQNWKYVRQSENV